MGFKGQTGYWLQTVTNVTMKVGTVLFLGCQSMLSTFTYGSFTLLFQYLYFSMSRVTVSQQSYHFQWQLIWWVKAKKKQKKRNKSARKMNKFERSRNKLLKNWYLVSWDKSNRTTLWVIRTPGDIWKMLLYHVLVWECLHNLETVQCNMKS